MTLDFNTSMDMISLLAIVAYLTPFILLQLKRISADNPLYSLLNLVGAGLILLTMMRDFNLASFVTNIVWSIFSLYGLFKALNRQKISGACSSGH